MSTNNLPAVIAAPDYEQLFNLCKRLSASKLFPAFQTPEAMLAVILAGRELGIPEISSLRNFTMVKGNMVTKAAFAAELIKRSGKYNYKIVEHTDKVCHIKFYENSVEIGEERYTIDDAVRAGLVSKTNSDGSNNNWVKYPKNMLFARCISNGQKWYCSDVFNGAIYTEGDDFSEPINVTPQANAAKPVKDHTGAVDMSEYTSKKHELVSYVKYLSKNKQNWLRTHFRNETGREMTFKDNSLSLEDFYEIDKMLQQLSPPSIQRENESEPQPEWQEPDMLHETWANLEGIWATLKPQQREKAFAAFPEYHGTDFSFSGSQRVMFDETQLNSMTDICLSILADGAEPA